jgi:hypothetical protein
MTATPQLPIDDKGDGQRGAHQFGGCLGDLGHIGFDVDDDLASRIVNRSGNKSPVENPYSHQRLLDAGWRP